MMIRNWVSGLFSLGVLGISAVSPLGIGVKQAHAKNFSLNCRCFLAFATNSTSTNEIWFNAGTGTGVGTREAQIDCANRCTDEYNSRYGSLSLLQQNNVCGNRLQSRATGTPGEFITRLTIADNNDNNARIPVRPTPQGHLFEVIVPRLQSVTFGCRKAAVCPSGIKPSVANGGVPDSNNQCDYGHYPGGAFSYSAQPQSIGGQQLSFVRDARTRSFQCSSGQLMGERCVYFGANVSSVDPGQVPRNAQWDGNTRQLFSNANRVESVSCVSGDEQRFGNSCYTVNHVYRTDGRGRYQVINGRVKFVVNPSNIRLEAFQ